MQLFIQGAAIQRSPSKSRSTVMVKAGALAIALLTSISGHAAKAPGQRADEHVRGRILLETRAGVSDVDLEKLIKSHGGRRVKLGQSRLHVIHLPPNVSEAEVIGKLLARPEVRFAELDQQFYSNLAVNDPYVGSAWHLGKIGAPAAWDTTLGGGVTIAILDSGIDAAHPDLAANIVSGTNTVAGNNDVSDMCGHGTAVAGAAAAAANNAIGVAGVAGAARIMPLRIVGTTCSATSSAIASALTYAADRGARIANISYGGVSSSAAVLSAANYMKSKGGLVFVSAGNNSAAVTIAPTNAVIVVSATNALDAKASFSNYGSFVSLSAPGEAIWTTSRGATYQAWSGTSFASPVAAGVAALMMAARPTLTNTQIESLLFSSALDLGTAQRDPVFGYGRVDATAAVAAARSYAVLSDTIAPTVSIAAPLGNSTVAGTVAVNVAATDNVAVQYVKLTANGTTVATDSAAPFSFAWNSANGSNGMVSLVAVAYDAAGNATSSAPVSVNVANAVAVLTPTIGDTAAPVVSINNPVSGAVHGSVAVSISATDNSGTAGIVQTLKIDGVLVAQGSGAALAYQWNTKKYTRGLHTLTATARDASGNSASRAVQVTIE